MKLIFNPFYDQPTFIGAKAGCLLNVKYVGPIGLVESGRRVGIISHREELKCIPVQIQVKRKGEGSSEIEIINLY